jgi:translation initiation factor 1A
MTPPENTYAKNHHSNSTTQDGDEGYYRLPLPNRKNNEMFAIADQLLGGSRIHVICEDKKSRMARIPGKMKRKARVRAGDLLIIKPWDIQNEKSDIVFRYSRTQASSLSRRKMLPEEINVF